MIYNSQMRVSEASQSNRYYNLLHGADESGLLTPRLTALFLTLVGLNLWKNRTMYFKMSVCVYRKRVFYNLLLIPLPHTRRSPQHQSKSVLPLFC
jgi:hypothetical protein